MALSMTLKDNDTKRLKSLKGLKGLKGHKAHLPMKVCEACGRPMSWRRAWARNWESVRYCSNACRQARGRSPAAKSAPAR